MENFDTEPGSYSQLVDALLKKMKTSKALTNVRDHVDIMKNRRPCINNGGKKKEDTKNEKF
jgi:hypothetical protein